MFLFFPTGTIVRDLTIPNLWHSISGIRICTEADFRLRWMKLCSSDNHQSTAPQHYCTVQHNTVPNNNVQLQFACFVVVILAVPRKLYRSVFRRKTNLKFYSVTSSNDTYQIQKISYLSLILMIIYWKIRRVLEFVGNDILIFSILLPFIQYF